ncbi:MAG: hypothetical protein LBR16_06765 [Treponema sp.]|jgi:hypothetical protein|nr:hypothetical protein [Treponema sp.]
MSRYTDILDEEHNEIMRDVRNRQAEAEAIYKRFEGNPEGYRQWMDADLAKHGWRLEPVGTNGLTRLVRIGAQG